MRSLALWARLVGWINGSTRRCCAIPDVAWYFAAASQQVIARQSTAVTVERNSGSRVQRQERAVNDCFSAAEQASRFGARQTHAGRRPRSQFAIVGPTGLAGLANHPPFLVTRLRSPYRYLAYPSAGSGETNTQRGYVYDNRFSPALECTGSHRASDLEHSRWLVAIGEEVMEGEIERGRDDERHCLGWQRVHLEHYVEQAEDRIRHDDATDAGYVKAEASVKPRTAMPRQVAEGHAIIGDEVRHDRDFGGDGKGDDIVDAV